MLTRRSWLRFVVAAPCCGALRAARAEFWHTKDPARWTAAEKQSLLEQSPWAQTAVLRMQLQSKRPPPSRENTGIADVPDTRPGMPPGAVRSVPTGPPPPPPPDPNAGRPLQFHVLARWESAAPVRLAGGPEVPEMTGQFYVIRLRGLPLLPAAKSNSNETMLQSIKEGSSLERRDRKPILCEHLFTGSAGAPNDVLLFFPHTDRPITEADRFVTLQSQFSVFELSVRFSLRDMIFQHTLAL